MVELRLGLVGALNEDFNVEKHEAGAQLGADAIPYFGFQVNVFKYSGRGESENDTSVRDVSDYISRPVSIGSLTLQLIHLGPFIVPSKVRPAGDPLIMAKVPESTDSTSAGRTAEKPSDQRWSTC